MHQEGSSSYRAYYTRYTRMFVSLRLPLLVILSLLLCACGPTVEWYPPPAQYVFDPGSEPRVVGAIAAMDDVHVEDYILSGVLAGDRGSP